jgi:hypothetical protein
MISTTCRLRCIKMSSLRLYVSECLRFRLEGGSRERMRNLVVAGLLAMPLTLASSLCLPPVLIAPVWVVVAAATLWFVIMPFHLWQSVHRERGLLRVEAEHIKRALALAGPDRVMQQEVIDSLVRYFDMLSAIQQDFMTGKDPSRIKREYASWRECVEHFLAWNFGEAYAAQLRKPHTDPEGELPLGLPMEAVSCWIDAQGKKNTLATILCEVRRA